MGCSWSCTRSSSFSPFCSVFRHTGAFGMTPHRFSTIQIRRITGQEMQRQSPVGRGHIIRRHFVLVRGQGIEHPMQRLLALLRQALSSSTNSGMPHGDLCMRLRHWRRHRARCARRKILTRSDKSSGRTGPAAGSARRNAGRDPWGADLAAGAAHPTEAGEP